MDEICVAKFDVYECRKSDRASALSGAQLNICAAQTPEFPDTIPTIWRHSLAGWRLADNWEPDISCGEE